MTEIFVREFARINEYFGATFTEMFGGGKASLEQAAQAADRAVVWTKPDGAGRYEQAYQKYCELFRTLNPLF